MLLQRIITALILIPVVLVLILKTSYLYFSLVLLVLLLLAIYEWANLFKFNKLCRVLYILSLLGITVSFLCCPYPIKQQYYELIFTVSVVTWIVLSLLVIVYNYNSKAIIFNYIKTSRLIQSVLGMVLIIPFGLAISLFKQQQNEYLLLIILIVCWVIDSGAYFVGKFLGKHKLIKNVSPGKTLEGLFGGLLSLGVLTLFIYYYFYPNFHNHDILNWCLYGFVIFCFAVFGDLAESMIKRIVQVKDSGNLIPGHGGILDRLDSLISVLPLYYLIVQRIV